MVCGSKIFLSTLSIVLLLFFAGNSIAAEEEDKKIQLPRFVSIRSDEVNVRTGPGVRYPIKWVIKRQNMPVEIIAEYEDWRKIRDIQQDEGWTHKAMLSSRRTALVKSEKKNVYLEPNEKSKLVAIANKGSLLKIDRCDGKFCEVESENVDGFIRQENLFGVYEGEKIKK